jgi:hypothetical protein
MSKLAQILKAIKLIKSLIDWLNAYWLNKKQTGDLGKIQDAEKKIEEAAKIADDAERIKQKTGAGREIEKTISGN